MIETGADRRGPGGRPLVLLFYDGYELKAREALGPRLFHRARCTARAVWRQAKGKQVNTGFFVAFLALVDGLRQLGCEVRINDFAAARARPDQPIGIAGYPSVLEQVDLPNPVIFGPGDPGYPDTAGEWAKRPNVRWIIQPSDWFVDYYRPYCGDKMLCCPVGVDVDKLPDASNARKSIDVLIYDKIRWDQDVKVPAVRGRLARLLDAQGRSYEILEYGKHTQQAYFAALSRSRSMAFLCEHETQGIACEEAMAMNVPVFAWEEKRLIDPRQLPFANADLQVSSIPYFDATCGLPFTEADLEDRWARFWNDLSTYSPRNYVAERLRPDSTARVYLQAYMSSRSAGPSGPTPTA